MERVLGIGGYFMRAADPVALVADLATEYSVGRSTVHRIIHGPETAR
ncbi:hypothetical protein [Nonomuraea sp. NPDC049695]